MVDTKFGNNVIGKGATLSLPYMVYCAIHNEDICTRELHNTVVQFNISFQRDQNLICYSLTVTDTGTYTYVATF